MPALPAVPSVLKVDLSYLVGIDATALNRLFWTYAGGPPSSDDCDLLAEHVSTAWSDQLESMFSSTTVLESVHVVDLTSSTSSEGFYVGSISGTRGGDDISGGAAALVGYAIGRRYRGGKPRTYLPAGTVSDLANRQAWTGGFLDEMNVQFPLFVTEVSAGAVGTTSFGHQVQVSYYSGTYATPSPTNPDRYVNRPVLRAAPVVDPITFAACRPHVASQRRRNLQRA